MRRPSLWGFVVVCFLTSCGKNRCPERVDELKAMAIDLRLRSNEREPLDYVVVADLEKGAAVPIRSSDDSKKPTFVVRAHPEEQLQAAPAIEALRALRSKGTVRLCAITPELRRQQSATADPKEVERALALVKAVLPEDRTTVLAGELGAADLCEINRCLDVGRSVAPKDKDSFMASCVAEALEDCGFPRRGSERAFAITTLMLDTWDYATDCVTVDPAGEAGAPAVVLEPKGDFGKLLTALRPHDGKAIRLELASP